LQLRRHYQLLALTHIQFRKQCHVFVPFLIAPILCRGLD
jgi:hypothetical protein